MRTVVLKAFTGADMRIHPDDSFITSAFVSFLPTDDYISESELNSNYLPVVLGQVSTSCERWLKVMWDNDDNTVIKNLRVYFSGQLPPGVYLRVGTSKDYQQPSTEQRIYTAEKTFNYGGDKDIIEGVESTYLFVDVSERNDNRVESDFIVLQLVVDGDRLPTYDILGSLELKIDYDEIPISGG
ncbi:MAG: hypothetical protein QXE80_03305 [Pyrobaculum sp.]